MHFGQSGVVGISGTKAADDLQLRESIVVSETNTASQDDKGLPAEDGRKPRAFFADQFEVGTSLPATINR
jgi:hypothetical protein